MQLRSDWLCSRMCLQCCSHSTAAHARRRQQACMRGCSRLAAAAALAAIDTAARSS